MVIISGKLRFITATYSFNQTDKALRLDNQHAKNHHRFYNLVHLWRKARKQNSGVHPLNNQRPHHRKHDKAPSLARAIAELKS